MRISFTLVAVALSTAVTSPGLAQTAAQSRAAATPVDLSGNWGAIGRSFSPKGGPQDAGTPADGVPYQPWALAKLKSQRTMIGPNATFATRTGSTLEATDTTDPVEQCEPHGVPRIYTWPPKWKFIQAPDVVYILYETGPAWRQVWLNRQHPEDPDPSYWGHSIGRYEGTDTFIVDSVGFNDKTWLDDVGRPHTEKLHVIERFRRVDQDRLEVTLTIDDPGAYTAPFTYGPSIIQAKKTVFGAAPWICTIEQNREFFKEITAPTLPPSGR